MFNVASTVQLTSYSQQCTCVGQLLRSGLIQPETLPTVAQIAIILILFPSNTSCLDPSINLSVFMILVRSRDPP